MSTQQILTAGLKTKDGAARYWLPQQPVLDSPEHDLPLDPYAYGALLGDGSLGTKKRTTGSRPRCGKPMPIATAICGRPAEHPGYCRSIKAYGNRAAREAQEISYLSIICPDSEILTSVATAATALGTTWRWDTPPGKCQSLVFHQNGRLSEVLAGLGALVHSEEKSVHPVYLQAGPAARRALLAGLLDTDGCATNQGTAVEFSSASPQLAADTAWLARSLGAVVTEAKPQAAGYLKNGIKTWCLDKHRLNIRFPAGGPNPFLVPRKASAWSRQAIRAQRRNPPRSFQAIEPAGTAEVCCIELDTEDDLVRVYLTDTTLIPTHNTGKSCGTIAGLLELQARGTQIFPLVIVVPGWDVATAWADEIARWAPHWRPPIEWKGPKRQELPGTADVFLVTYATARLDAASADGPLCRLNPVAVVLDEVHFCSKPAALQTKAAQRITRHARVVIGLSGTLVTTHVGDGFSALAILDERSWPSGDRYKKRYCRTGFAVYGEPPIEGLDPLREPEFRLVTAGTLLRRSKADVLPQLPPKIYSVRKVELPDDWRKAYDGLAADMLAQLPDGEELSIMDTLSQLTFLSRMACSAGDVTITEGPEINEFTGELKKHYHFDMRAPSWKADVLMEILAERPGKPVVAFTPDRQMAVIAGQQAEKEGLRVGYLTGTGNGVTSGSRKQAIADFQAGKLDLLAATSGAGGTGITLTAAGTAVFLARPRPLAEAIQAENRVHRWGSEIHEHGVEIIDIIARGTVDSRRRELLKGKAGQLAEFVNDKRIVRELFGGR